MGWTASPCIFAAPDLWNSSPTAHHNGAIHHSPKQPLCSALHSKMSVQKEGTLYYRIIQEYKTNPLIFVGASASTMLSSAELICLCLAMARSSRPGRNCALPAPGGSIYLSGKRPFGTVSRIVHFGAVSCVHCAGFALFLVDIVAISKVSFVLYLFVFLVYRINLLSTIVCKRL